MPRPSYVSGWKLSPVIKLIISSSFSFSTPKLMQKLAFLNWLRAATDDDDADNDHSYCSVLFANWELSEMKRTRQWRGCECWPLSRMCASEREGGRECYSRRTTITMHNIFRSIERCLKKSFSIFKIWNAKMWRDQMPHSKHGSIHQLFYLYGPWPASFSLISSFVWAKNSF